MPGSRFKEFIDRAFLGNRGYDYQTGTWNRQGVTSGLIGGIGNAIVPGAGTLARFIYDRSHNHIGDPTQSTLDTGSGYQRDFGGLNAPDLNIHYGTDPGLSGYQDFGGLNAPDLNFHGYNGGDPMTPSTTTLNPVTPNVPIDATLNAPDLNIKTGNSGGQSGTGSTGNMGGSYGGGMYTSGTLGGGYAVDPSQWGAYGLGGDSGPQNGGLGLGYQTQLMSGGMHEGAGGGGQLATFLASRRNGNTGIVPPNTRTGGMLPPYLQPPVKTGGGGQIGG